MAVYLLPSSSIFTTPSPSSQQGFLSSTMFFRSILTITLSAVAFVHAADVTREVYVRTSQTSYSTPPPSTFYYSTDQLTFFDD